MNHAEARSHMPDYLEGDLGLSQRALLDAHLDACESCSHEFGEMSSTIALLRGLPDPDPPPFLVETVMRRIREGEANSGFGDRLREWIAILARPQLALPATALAAGLLLATGIFDTALLPGLGGDASPPKAAFQVIALHQDPGAQTNGLQPVVREAYFGNAPPVVARAPRISIGLPNSLGGLATARITAKTVGNEARRAPRVVTRWSPRSSRSLNLAEPPARSVPVSNRVSVDRAGSAFSPSVLSVSEDTREARRNAELDQRLERMVSRPVSFAAEFSGLSVAEQEIWLSFLAERAEESGRSDEALESLRVSRDGQADRLANAFSLQLKQARELRELASLEDGGAGSDR